MGCRLPRTQPPRARHSFNSDVFHAQPSPQPLLIARSQLKPYLACAATLTCSTNFHAGDRTPTSEEPAQIKMTNQQTELGQATPVPVMGQRLGLGLG